MLLDSQLMRAISSDMLLRWCLMWWGWNEVEAGWRKIDLLVVIFSSYFLNKYIYSFAHTYVYILWNLFLIMYVFSDLIGLIWLRYLYTCILYVVFCSLSLIAGIDLATLVGLRTTTTTTKGEGERKDHNQASLFLPIYLS